MFFSSQNVSQHYFCLWKFLINSNNFSFLLSKQVEWWSRYCRSSNSWWHRARRRWCNNFAFAMCSAYVRLHLFPNRRTRLSSQLCLHLSTTTPTDSELWIGENFTVNKDMFFISIKYKKHFNFKWTVRCYLFDIFLELAIILDSYLYKINFTYLCTYDIQYYALLNVWI